MSLKGGTKVEQLFVGSIDELQFSILALGKILLSTRSGLVLWWSLERPDNHCECYGALLGVPH